MKVSFLALDRQSKKFKREIKKAIDKTIDESQYILGESVRQFEKEFSHFLNIKYCVTVNSGTDALILGLEALNLPAKSEVIVPVNTFIATAFAVSKNNLIPVFVDINEDDFSIDLKDLEKKITKKTSAVIAVHLYGLPSKVKEIREIINKKNKKIALIEDACQAHGASIANRKVGNFGEFAAFSFYPGKNLGAMGDGGAIVTNNKAIYEKCLLLRNYGQVKKYDHQILGTNSRLDSLQANILLAKLKHLDSWNRKRQIIAQEYEAKLKSLRQIKLPNKFEDRIHVYHQFVIKAKDRNNLQKYLENQGISTLIHYPRPLHLQNAYAFLGYKRGDFPIAEELSQKILSLPIYPELTEKEIDYTCQKIINFYSKK